MGNSIPTDSPIWWTHNWIKRLSFWWEFGIWVELKLLFALFGLKMEENIEERDRVYLDRELIYKYSINWRFLQSFLAKLKEI